QPKLAALLRELNWTQNILILARAKRPEEREFYLRLCAREKWPSRELERQLAGALFERKKRAPEALAYNGLVQSWPELLRLAQQGGKPKAPAEQEQLEI
ncbi:MAG TPA: DUF1016 N-terminal domain-containing protein, partial [Verrucomicrobiae bacterium]